MKKVIVSCFLFFHIVLMAQKKPIYLDEFGKKITKKEARSFSNYEMPNNYVLVKYQSYDGTISDSLQNKIVDFLEKESGTTIDRNKVVVIEGNINEGNCNIRNMSIYHQHVTKMKSFKNVHYTEVISQYNPKYEGQIVDQNGLIFGSFFSYYKWKIPAIEKCGGTLLIFPNNQFIRIAGDGFADEVFKILEKVGN
ncbi:MAG: hypothetical protein J0M25_05050 [Flavobacteriales bacterium]|nr:hypothetical protein [Flavobacteriales bacterium]